MTDERMLVLVVDADSAFVESTRGLLAPHRTLTARDLDEAREIVLGGRVDVVVLGPAFASEHSVTESAALRSADPTVQIVLAADIVTNRLLKAALRSGFADVVDIPLTAAALATVVPLPATDDGAREIDLVLEPDPAAPLLPPPHHPSQYEPTEPDAPEETLGSGNGWLPDDLNPQAASAGAPSDDRRAEEGALLPNAPAVAQPIEPASVDAVPSVQPDEPDSVEEPRVAPTDSTPPVWPDEGPSQPEESEPISQEVTPPPYEPEPPTPPTAPPTRIPPEPDVAVPEPPTSPPPAPISPVAPPPYESPEPEIEREAPALPRGPGRVIAVMAGKGGSGKSVVATNLAIALGLRGDPERVAIVDADLQFGDVALMLQIDPVRTIDDVVGRLDSMTDARLDGALLRHESGLRVLPAPLLPVRHDEITAKSVVEVVERLRNLYDTIVVDTGPVFDDGLVTILEHADAVVTVVDMDLPSVKNSKVALDALRGAGFPMDRITMVVNRVNSKARLDLAELERSLGLRVGGSVPSDRLVPQSVNEGIPLLALSPRSKVARSFMALAERLDPRADRARLGGTDR